MTASLKPHPHNPHGVLVPCAICGREIHAPRADFTERRTVHLSGGGTKVKDPVDPSQVTCSYACMTALRDA